MPSLTIRNLEAETKARLRVRAALNGRSMEEEARVILNQAVGGMTGNRLLDLSRELFGDDNGIELEAPPCPGDRSGPDFSGA